MYAPQLNLQYSRRIYKKAEIILFNCFGQPSQGENTLSDLLASFQLIILPPK